MRDKADLRCDFSGHLSPTLWILVRSTGGPVVEVGLVGREAASFLQAIEGSGHQAKG